MKLIDSSKYPERFSYPLETDFTPVVDSFMMTVYSPHYMERFNNRTYYLGVSDLEQNGFNHGSD